MNQPTYRRTPPPPERPPPGRLPQGRRLVIVLVGLVVLAVLTLAIVLISDSEDDAASTSTTSAGATSTTGRVGGSAPDIVVAGQVLPATLGPGWAEVAREADPVPAEADPADACSAIGQPIQQGLVVRASFDHLGASDVVERAALVAGVVEEGIPVPRLDDPAVADCLEQGLRGQVPEGGELVAVDQGLGPAPDGAEVSGARYDVRDEDGEPGGRFELLLVRRDRAVSFALVAVFDLDAATPVDDLVSALDAPLAVAAPRLN